jgi:hypothetical protein
MVSPLMMTTGLMKSNLDVLVWEQTDAYNLITEGFVIVTGIEKETLHQWQILSCFLYLQAVNTIQTGHKTTRPR